MTRVRCLIEDCLFNIDKLCGSQHIEIGNEDGLYVECPYTTEDDIGVVEN